MLPQPSGLQAQLQVPRLQQRAQATGHSPQVEAESFSPGPLQVSGVQVQLQVPRSQRAQVSGRRRPPRALWPQALSQVSGPQVLLLVSRSRSAGQVSKCGLPLIRFWPLFRGPLSLLRATSPLTCVNLVYWSWVPCVGCVTALLGFSVWTSSGASPKTGP